jgi:predicted ATP-grasp superfamily ATP-dependent carboligase
MKVLVMDANHKNALAAVRSLGRAGMQVITMGPKLSQSHLSRFSKSQVLTAGPSAKASELLTCVKKFDVDFVIPVGASSVQLVDSIRDELALLTKFSLPSRISLDVAFDKFALQERARMLGIGVPKTWVFDTYWNFLEAVREIPLPLAIRSTTHFSSIATLYVRNNEELATLIKQDLATPMFMSGPVQVQELISGVGEGYFALYQEGALRSRMMHRRLRETPSTGGSSWAAESQYSEDLSSQSKKLLDSLEWNGPAMVEFKRRESNGQLVLIELNPKLWGSLDLTISAGVDIPVLMTLAAFGGPMTTDLSFEEGVSFWWPLDSFAALKGRRLLEKKRVANNVYVSDPRPALSAGMQMAYSTLIASKIGSKAAKIRHWRITGVPGEAWSRFVGEIWGIPIRRDSRITNALWVGAAPSKLGSWYIRRVLSMTRFSLLSETKEERQPIDQKVYSKHVPEFVQIPPELMHEIASEISALVSSGVKVYLHCREGVGRAPTIAIAHELIGGLSLDEAKSKVFVGRRFTRLTELQESSLDEFVKYLQKL